MKRRPPLLITNARVRRIHAALVDSADMARCEAACVGLLKVDDNLGVADMLVVASQIVGAAIQKLDDAQRTEMLAGLLSLTHDKLAQLDGEDPARTPLEVPRANRATRRRKL